MSKETITHIKRGLSPLEDEHRRSQRIYLQLPLFVRGRDPRGEQFLELAKTLDISAIGALIVCPKPLTLGEIVTVTIPAPSIPYSALVPASMPPIQAKVKRQQAAGEVYLAGVEFLKPIG